jgi:hypothetical protein
MVEAPGYVAGLSDLMTTEIRPKTPTRHRENAPSSAGHRVIIEAPRRDSTAGEQHSRPRSGGCRFS